MSKRLALFPAIGTALWDAYKLQAQEIDLLRAQIAVAVDASSFRVNTNERGK